MMYMLQNKSAKSRLLVEEKSVHYMVGKYLHWVHVGGSQVSAVLIIWVFRHILAVLLFDVIVILNTKYGGK